MHFRLAKSGPKASMLLCDFSKVDSVDKQVRALAWIRFDDV